MKRTWRMAVTCLCLLMCAGGLLWGMLMERGESKFSEDQNLQVMIWEDCGVYELGFFQEGSGGGAMNADGSPMKKGQSFGWEAGAGEKTVTVTALNGLKRVIHETTVTFDFSQGPCVLLLTEEGFVPYEA